MKLAVSGYEFKGMSFAEIVQFLGKLGVDYLELWPENVAGENVAEVRALLGESGIQVSCVSAASRFRLNAEEVSQAQAAIRKALDLASTFGASYVTTYLGGNPQRDFLTTLKLYKQNLQPCLEEAAARGIKILLENMFDNRNEDPDGTKPSRHPEGMRALFEAVTSEHFAITYDPVNFYICGVEPYPYAYEYLAGCIANVHIKDTKKYSELLHGDRSQYPIWEDSVTGEYISVPVGQGALNVEAIIRRLMADGYQGYVTVDILTTEANFAPAYRESVNYLRSLLD